MGIALAPGADVTGVQDRLHIGLVVAGGFDESGRERVTPSLLALVERLARDHQVTVYVLRYHDRPRTYSLAGAMVRDLGRPEGIRRQYEALSSAIAVHGKPDLLHAYLGFPQGLVTTLVAKRHGIPAVVTMDSGEFVSIESAGYGLQRRWRHRAAIALSCRLADAVTVCTSYQARLAEQLGFATRIIPLGVDTAFFEPRAPSDGPPWRLIHVASLNDVKDQHTLLTALADLQTRLSEFTLDIVGEDVRGGALQRLASQLGLSRRVTFHGFQPADALLPLLQHSHLMIMSSLHEAACVAVLEASACGVATVGTRVGYLADWCAEGRAAAVPIGSPHALASAIERLLRDGAGRRDMAARAREWAVAHNADATARQFTALYESLTAGRRRSR